MERQDIYEQIEMDERDHKDQEIKKKKAHELRKKIFLQKIMSGDIDIADLKRKKKKKEKKKKKKQKDNNNNNKEKEQQSRRRKTYLY